MRGGPMVDSLDDAHWFDVARLELPDGRIARIQEAWIRLSPRYVCFYNKWDPGAITPRHGHHGDHSILVVKGQVSDGIHVCGPGSHIMLEYGDTFGPWEAGPEGCEMYGVIMGVGHPFMDKAEWRAYLAGRGIVEHPCPPPPLPAWSAGMNVLPADATASN